MTRHFSQRFLRKMIIADAVAAPAPSVAVAAYDAVTVMVIEIAIRQCC